jgi:excisionase family DNA binding protein
MKTTTDIATTLGVSTRTVTRWIAAGRLRAIKIAGTIRILDDDYDKFVQDHATCPTNNQIAETGGSATPTPQESVCDDLLELRRSRKPGPKKTVSGQTAQSELQHLAQERLTLLSLIT